MITPGSANLGAQILTHVTYYTLVEGDWHLTFGEKEDWVTAYGGNDWLDTAGAKDSITAGAGNDTVFARSGDDTASGGMETI